MTLTINQARKILGKNGSNFTNDQVQDLLDEFYGLAEVIAEVVKQKGSNKHVGVIDSSDIKTQNEAR